MFGKDGGLFGAPNISESSNAIKVVNDDSTNATVYPIWVTGTSGNQPAYVCSGKLTFNASTGILRATTFSGGISATNDINVSDGKAIKPTTGTITNSSGVSPSTDLTVGGNTETFTAGENVAFGDPCYIKSDGKIWKADANGSGTYPVMYLAAATILANASGVFLRNGFARNDAWNWTVGSTIYLSTAAGLTQTAPSTTGDVMQVVGRATHADRMDFNPSRDYFTVA
jgi:hypothetical protein